MPATGKTIGNYRIGPLLGGGLLGEVYLAEHETIGRKAAVKIIHPAIASRTEAVSLFFSVVDAVKHPGAVEVFEKISDDKIGCCVVMELLEGESLAARLSRCDPLPLGSVVRIVRDTAVVLDAGSRDGLTHGSLKTENVFVLKDSRVKVLDFGAHHLAQGDPALMATEYMSPEQCEGKAPGPATDVYALATIAYLLLAGRSPFLTPDIASMIQMHRQVEPPPLPIRYADLPSTVGDLLAVALSKDPGQRPPSCTALAQSLLEAVRPALQIVKSSEEAPEQHGSIAVGGIEDGRASRPGSGDVETVRRERHPIADDVESSRRARCPHCCQYVLKPAMIFGTEVDVCPLCRGVWFDEGEIFDVLNERATEQPSTEGTPIDIVGDRLESTEHRCPGCGEPLVSYTFADLENLKIDICELCEGFWLDDGELAVLQRQRWQSNTRLRIRRRQRDDTDS